MAPPLRAHACGGIDFERREVSGTVGYDEHRAPCKMQDSFSDAAKQQATDRAAAVRADHNQVRLLFFGCASARIASCFCAASVH